MNWKSTLVLVVLAGLSGLWLWKGDEWGANAPPAAPQSPTLAALDADFAPDKITRVEVPAADEPLVLERAGGGWRMPGNWPLRTPEAEELVNTLANLRTRFQPIPADSAADLGAFGLASPTVVKVTANGKAYTLAFGEPPAKPDDGPFTRPAYLRVNDFPEVLRLGPDVLPVLKRPAEAYRKRQLFPDADRVKLAAAPAAPPSPFGPPPGEGSAIVALLGDKVTQVAVTGPGTTHTVLGIPFHLPDGTFTLKRTAPLPTPTGTEKALSNEQLASAWEIDAPFRDRPDPAALRRVLAAVPDLWAEEFADPAKAKVALDHPAAIASMLPLPFEPVIAAAGRHVPNAPLVNASKLAFEQRTLLEKPAKTVAVTRADGTTVTIQVGGIAKVEERDEPVQVPGGPPGSPPRTITTKVPEEYRYAKVAGNPLAFVVKAAPLQDVFTKLDEIRDARVARFDRDDVEEIEVAAKGQPAIKLTRKKGDPKAADDAAKSDRWFLDARPAPVLADPAKVNDLIRQLADLRAEGADAIASHPDPKAFEIADGTAVTITTREKRPDGEPPAAPKTLTLRVGKVNPETKKLPVQVAGWERINLVPETVAAALTRPGTEYLDRNLLTLGEPSKLASVKIAGTKPEQAIALTKDEKGFWKAEGATFAVDTLTVGQIAQVVAPLQVKSVAAFGDAVKWADYGLEPPEFTLTLTATGDKPATHTIKLGKADPAGGRYARIDDGKAVAVLDAQASMALAKARPDFIDRTLLTFDPTTLAGLTRKKGTEELEIVPGAAIGWDVVKPSKQKADPVLMEQLAESLGKLRAERVVAQGPKDVVFKSHGLDSPAATITLTIGEKAETKVLKIGSPVDAKNPDGDRHAAVDGPDTEAVVGVLSGDFAGKLLAAPNAFRDRTLAKFVDADTVTLERGDRKITFAKLDGGWKATTPVTDEAESLELDEFVNRLAKLQAAELVADKPTAADLKKFGLDKPEAKWTVSDKGADVLVLLVGKKEPGKGAYAKTEKGEVVGLLTPDLTGRALAEYRRRRAWDGIDTQQIESVEITRGKASFTLAKRGPLWIDPAKPADPIDPRAVNELVGTLAGLRAARYAADKDADPKLFGLDEPELVFTVTQRDGPKRVLHLGGAAGGGEGKQVYARVADPGRTDVFVLSEIDTTRLTRERAVYVEKKPEPPKPEEKKDEKK